MQIETMRLADGKAPKPKPSTWLLVPRLEIPEPFCSNSVPASSATMMGVAM